MVTIFLLGAIFVAWALKFPKPFAAVSLLLLVMAKPISQWLGDPYGYIDEAVPLLCVIIFSGQRLASGRKLRPFPGLGWFLAFGVIGLASSIVASVAPGIFILGAYLLLKGLVFGVAVVQLDWTDEDLQKLTKWGAWVFAAYIALGLANLAIPMAWAGVFAESGQVDYQMGLPSVIGPFIHPGDFGIVMAVGTLAVLAYRKSIRSSRSSLALLIGGAFMAFMSLRRKTWAGVLLATGWIQARTAKRGVIHAIRSRPWAAIFGVALLVSAGTALWLNGLIEQTYLQYFARWESSPRSLLTVSTLQVASEHFPFGAGFGRYGSYLAGVEYSPEYIRLGFDSIWGLSSKAGNGDYLTDTQWPAIFGESGWLGGLAYIAGLWRIGRVFQDGRHPWESQGWASFLSLVGAAWLVEVLVESIAGPVLMASPAFGLIFFIAAVKRSHATQSQTHTEAIPKGYPSNRRRHRLP